MDPAAPARFRVLFVCAMNRWRSPTAEHLYRTDPRLEVRSAGTRTAARRRVSDADLDWADVIFVMEREQARWIASEFRDREIPPIRVLDVPDEHRYMDPALQEILRSVIDPEIEALISGADGTR